MNRDGAQQALDIGKRALMQGDNAKAERMFEKSKRLCPLPGIDDLLKRARGESTPTPTSPSRAQTKSATSSASTSSTTSSDFTPEQEGQVRRINQAKDFYDIFGLPKGSSFEENQLKKAYRKVALKVHPDKNSAPGAEEAFKKVGEAFSTLSDPRKKQIYDLHGPEAAKQADSRGGGGGFGGAQFGGHGDMTPEELFEFLFTGRPPQRGAARRAPRGFSNQGFQRGGFQFHTNFGGRPPFGARAQRAQPHGAAGQERTGLAMFLQFLPLLFILFSVLFSGFSSPAFSTYRTSEFSVQRETTITANHLPYFVPKTFDHSNRAYVQKVEREVHATYKEHCQEEIYTVRRLMKRDWRGRLYHSDRSKNYPTPYCDALHVNTDPQQQ